MCTPRTPTSDGVAVFTRDVPAYDIDGDGQSDPLTDGLLLLRYLFGFTGASGLRRRGSGELHALHGG